MADSEKFDWTKNVNISDPIESLRLMRGSSMTQLGDYLYVDGGDYYYSGFNGTWFSRDGPPDNDGKWAANDYMFALDLTQNYPERNFTEMSPHITATKKTDTPGWTSTIGGYIETVGNKIYHAGGVQTHYKLPSGSSTTWSYDGKNYEAVEPKGDASALNVYNGASTSSPDGMIYLFAGQDSKGKTMTNLVKWDVEKNNVEILSKDNPFVTGTGLLSPSLNWIPVGEKGSLVTFGGSLMKGEDSIQGNPTNKAGVFDIANKKWYTQPIVSKHGDDVPPATRRHFCAVTPTPNKSQQNWEIFIYGGLSGEAGLDKTGDRYDDVWVLTIPTFQWIKFYTQPGDSNWGKYNRSCTLINDKYLTFLDQISTNQPTDDVDSALFAFYDIVKAKGFAEPGSFRDFDPSDKGYSTPLKISVAISDPSENQLETGLSDVLSKSYFQPNNASALEPVKTAPASKGSIGPIVGGVVGGIAAIALLGFLLWFLRRRGVFRKKAPEVPYGNAGGRTDAERGGGGVTEHKAELPAIPPPPIYHHGGYQGVPQTTHEVYGDEVAAQHKPVTEPQRPVELQSELPPAELPADNSIRR